MKFLVIYLYCSSFIRFGINLLHNAQSFSNLVLDRLLYE